MNGEFAAAAARPATPGPAGTAGAAFPEPARLEQGPPTPPEARLAMPAQNLRRAPKVRFGWPGWRTLAARLVAFGGAAALTTVGYDQMTRVFESETIGVLQVLLRLLFVATFAWIAFSATAALAGLLFAPPRPKIAERGRLASRTAIVMPVYQEDAAATAGALAALGRGLAEMGCAEAFEIFILSDTRQADAWARETTALAALRAELPQGPRVWYRRREENKGRKAGNVQDFVERWGGRYDFMLVLDADSVMTPETVVEMVRRMEAEPRLGLLQTVPALVGATTPFGRVQQFAGRLYGPAVARGVSAWQGLDGNFWGHNALIRTRAFAESAGLPVLKGPRPFGGHILSHDFVEAALLRRAGWGVRMDPDLEGSYEGAPPSLTAASKRDRRWAQGNLQHAQIVIARGVRWPNRAHFLIGIGSYIASPLWLGMIVVGLALTAQALFFRPEFFSQAYQLFPDWPRFDAVRMRWLFAGSMALLLTPKVIGLLRGLLLGPVRRAFGGGGRLVASALVEIVLSALIAPIFMLMQTRHVFEILIGRDSGWAPQAREGGALPWRDAVFMHWGHVTAGLVTTAAVATFQPPLLVWLSPVLLGLVLEPWLSRESGDARAGAALAGAGFLLTPEDRAPGPIFREAEEAEARIRARSARGFADLACDVRLLAAHRRALSPPEARAPLPETLWVARVTAAAKAMAAPSAEDALRWLSETEKVALLAEPGDGGVWERLNTARPHPAEDRSAA